MHAAIVEDFEVELEETRLHRKVLEGRLRCVQPLYKALWDQYTTVIRCNAHENVVDIYDENMDLCRKTCIKFRTMARQSEARESVAECLNSVSPTKCADLVSNGVLLKLKENDILSFRNGVHILRIRSVEQLANDLRDETASKTGDARESKSRTSNLEAEVWELKEDIDKERERKDCKDCSGALGHRRSKL